MSDTTTPCIHMQAVAIMASEMDVEIWEARTVYCKACKHTERLSSDTWPTSEWTEYGKRKNIATQRGTE